MVLKYHQPAWYVILCALSWFGLCLSGAGTASAEVVPNQVRLTSKRVAGADWQAEGLSVQWKVPNVSTQAKDAPKLTVGMDELTLSAWPKHIKHIKLRCTPTVASAWRCGDGHLALSTTHGRLAGSFGVAGGKHPNQDQEPLDVSWKLPLGHLAIKQRADQSWRLQLRGWDLPKAWPWLSEWLPDWSVSSGTLRGDVVVRPNAQTTKIDARVEVGDLALSNDDGSVLTEQLNWQGRVTGDFSSAWQRINVDGVFNQGDLLFGDWYVGLPKRPISLRIQAQAESDKPWVVPHFSLTDTQDGQPVMRLSGNMRMDATGLAQLDAKARLHDAETAWADYLKALLAGQTSAIDGVSGGLEADIQWRKQGMESLSLEANGLTLHGANDAWRVDGLQGAWQMRSRGAPFAWSFDGLTLHGTRFDGATLRFQNHEKHVRLTRPVELSVLQGVLRLDEFVWHWKQGEMPSNHPATVMEAALSLRELSMPALTEQLGWPVMQGSLSARLPTFRWRSDDTVTLDGGLDVQVFDGSVRIEQISLERLFGVAPVIVADVLLNDLSLTQLTSAFGVGSISGRLDGAIKSLRMVDFQPAAFDASFRTDPNTKEPRRISQRAVGELSSVGGAAGMASIQSSVLRFFSDFGYKQIAFSCRLKNDVCHMAGLDQSTKNANQGRGYVIVEGAGLPQITVVGYERRVDWPTLVNRLKAAAEGEGPTIE